MDPSKFLTYVPIFTALSAACEAFVVVVGKIFGFEETSRASAIIHLLSAFVFAWLALPIEPSRMDTVPAIFLYGLLIVGGSRVWHAAGTLIADRYGKASQAHACVIKPAATADSIR
jgi:hypothetical protein